MKPLRLAIAAPWTSPTVNYYLELERLFTLCAKNIFAIYKKLPRLRSLIQEALRERFELRGLCSKLFNLI